MRVSSSGDQMAGGGHLRDAEDPARRVVQSVMPGAIYIDGGELKGGGRSSGLSGFGVAVHSRSNWRGFWSSGIVLSTSVRPVVALGDGGHDGDMAGGAELAAPVESAATGQE